MTPHTPVGAALSERELREAVEGFREGILAGRSADLMCYAVCAPLQGLLSFAGVETELIELDFETDDRFDVMSHFVLRMADGNIIDPTADQFGLPPVYIGSMPEQYAPPGGGQRKQGLAVVTPGAAAVAAAEETR